MPWPRQTAVLLVLGAASVLAVLVYRDFVAVERHLWHSPLHDRNAHYAFGLNVAVNLRNGDLAGLRHNLDGARVWGPLHGLLVAAGQVFAPGNFRLAIMPSLFGWVLAAVFAFLSARRLVRSGGTLAGFAAALAVLVSPSHRAFATDVMLESLGACFSLAALYVYLRTVQGRQAWAGVGLGLALTALFFLKYNYWLLVVFAITANEIGRQPRLYLHLLRDLAGRVPWRIWLTSQLRHPLSYVMLALALLAGWVSLTGGTTFSLFGHPVSMHNAANLCHFFYILLFVRTAFWLRRHAALLGQIPLGVQQLLMWHVLPVAGWFLLPKRLGYFLWYVGPAHPGTRRGDLLGGLVAYWNDLVLYYHHGLAATLLVVGLLAAAILGRKSLKPGGTVFLWFILLAALLAGAHRNQQTRFLHSWIAGAWVAAGAGLALCVYNRWTMNRGRLAHGAAAAALAGLAALQLPALARPAFCPNGGPKPTQPSLLDITETYLPHLADRQRTAFVCPMPLKFLVNWTFLQRYPDTRRVETELKGFGYDSPEPGKALRNWLNRTQCDTVIFFDIPRDSCFTEPPWVDLGSVPELLAARSDFTFERRWDFPQYNCRVWLYKRTTTPGQAARR